jgi:hypothetical protein
VKSKRDKAFWLIGANPFNIFQIVKKIKIYLKLLKKLKKKVLSTSPRPTCLRSCFKRNQFFMWPMYQNKPLCGMFFCVFFV